MRKHEKKDLTFVTPLDWARLAMAIDCEGHIQIGHSVHKDPKFQGARSRYEYINIVVSNTDVRLMQWIIERFGGRLYVYPRNKKVWKDAYRWNIACTQAAEILRGCLPYFVVKREQAEIALALQATMKRVGIAGTPAHVIQHRAQLRDQLKALTVRGPQPLVNAS